MKSHSNPKFEKLEIKELKIPYEAIHTEILITKNMMLRALDLSFSENEVNMYYDHEDKKYGELTIASKALKGLFPAHYDRYKCLDIYDSILAHLDKFYGFINPYPGHYCSFSIKEEHFISDPNNNFRYITMIWKCPPKKVNP
jgi:hypothetical protein